jgi:L-ribulose-5-phosphate 4-epimerase
LSNTEENLRKRLVKIGKMLFKKGLTYGTFGNISARTLDPNLCLIKPSGVSLNKLESKDFLLINIKSRKILKSNKKPSIETPFHIKLYQERKEVGGIVHTHSKYCTIFSIIKKEILPMGFDLYQAPSFAKGIPISKFALPGTHELADNIVEAMKEHIACLIPHHGLTTIGKTIEEAALNAEIAEKLAQLNYETMLVGEPKPLPKETIQNLLKKAREKKHLF